MVSLPVFFFFFTKRDRAGRLKFVERNWLSGVVSEDKRKSVPPFGILPVTHFPEVSLLLLRVLSVLRGCCVGASGNFRGYNSETEELEWIWILIEEKIHISHQFAKMSNNYELPWEFLGCFYLQWGKKYLIPSWFCMFSHWQINDQSII